MAEVIVTDESTESGAFRALKAERRMHKETERKLATLRSDLGARVERLEQRGLAPVLDALSGIRRDLGAENARLRAELTDLAEQVEQLRSMLAQP